MRLEQNRGPDCPARMTRQSPFRYFRTSPEIVLPTVRIFIYFPLSLRNEDDLLDQRALEVSLGTVRFGS